MNKEYVYLNSGEIAVTDENGVITKRKVLGNDKEILTLENKVDAINSAIDEFNKLIGKEQYNIIKAKTLKKLRYIVTVISFVVYLATIQSGGLIFFLGYSIYNLMFANIFKHIEKTTKKEINDLKNKINECSTIKQNYEKVLEKEKQKVQEPTVINSFTNDIFKLDDVNIDNILNNNEEVKVLKKIKK